MIPQNVKPGRFTARGRLTGRWQAALAEPDPRRRLPALLHLVPEFIRHPRTTAELWPSFLDSVLRGPHAAGLTPADLAGLDTAATTVSTGSKGRLPLAEACFPLLLAREARGEHRVVAAMLTRLYWSPDLPPSGKSAVPRMLALRGAAADEHLSVYVDSAGALAPHDEPPVTALLTRCLATGFTVPPVQVRRAGDLARRLREKDAAVTGVDLALGYASLLLDRDAEAAAGHLTAAHGTNRNALPGLLSALVRTGDHDRVTALAAEATEPHDAVVRGLVALSTALRWLDEPALTGRAPSTAARLAALPVGVQAGEWLGYAIGRMHLLEGATRAAAATLVAVADRCPRQRHWNYHAAWALHLLGDRDGVARRYELADGWAQRWTVGLVLTDANPERAPEHTGLTAAHASVVAARTALRPPRHGNVAPAELPADAPEPMVVRLEALRTNLGVHVARSDTAALAAAMADPVFARLPLADQLLWAGLAEPGQSGNALLAQAADGFGYQRAGLVLGVRDLRRDRLPGPDRLAGLSWRTDATVELVRAWSALVVGDVEGAKARAARFADDARAQYVLGTAWLLTAHEPGAFATAADSFARALAGDGDLPGETALLRRCAAIAAGPDNPGTDLDGPAGTPWTAWTLALAGVHHDPGAVPPGTYEQLVTQLEQAQAPAPAATLAVATGLVHAAARAESDGTYRALFDRAERTAPGPEVTRLRELMTATAVRAGHAPPAGEQLPAATALALAERAPADDHTVLLRAVAGGAGAGFCHTLAAFLAGEPVTPPPEDEQATAAATGLLVTAAAVTDDVTAGLDHLLALLRTSDLADVVDLRGVLPALCAGASRSRQVPPHLEELVRAAVAADLLPPAVLAQCASVIGDRELALTLHRRAFEDDPDTGRAYAAALWHEAALARRAGKERRALICLLQAAVVTGDRDQPLPSDRPTTAWILGQAERSARGDVPGAGLARHALYELCTSLLLAHLLGDGRAARGTAGRLSALEYVIAGSHTLRTGLLDGDPRTVGRVWRNLGTSRSRDIHLHHTLAVLYREHGLAAGTDAAADATILATATTLWSLLLSTQRFWHHAGERAEAEEPRLREAVCRELFAAHGTRGRRALAAGDTAAATTHLRVLTAYGDNPAKPVAVLDTAGLRYRHDVDTDRFSRVSAIAADVLAEWVGDVVTAATAVLEDETAREPDHAGAIAALGPFLALGVPVPSVLRTALEWYNEWSLSEYQRENGGRVAELTTAAARVADALMPLCTKGQGLRPENQALSRHVMFRGFTTTDDHDDAVRQYEAALAWNPGNANAQQLLDQRAEFEIEEQLAKAQRAIEDGRFAAALAQLKTITTQTPDLRQVKERLIHAAKLSAAVAKKQWTAAERMLREEMATASATDRGVIGKQLAALLNTHAVELADGAKPFAEAIVAIFEKVRAGANDPYSLSLGRRIITIPGFGDLGGGRADCAVCGGAAATGRAEVVQSLLIKVRAQGEVRADGVLRFWARYEQQLCTRCASALHALPEAQRTAITLLSEARQLDPRSQVIRTNLDHLRRNV